MEDHCFRSQFRQLVQRKEMVQSSHHPLLWNSPNPGPIFVTAFAAIIYPSTNKPGARGLPWCRWCIRIPGLGFAILACLRATNHLLTSSDTKPSTWVTRTFHSLAPGIIIDIVYFLSEVIYSLFTN